MTRLPMGKKQHVLPISAEGFSSRRIAGNLTVGRTTVQAFLESTLSPLFVIRLPSTQRKAAFTEQQSALLGASNTFAPVSYATHTVSRTSDADDATTVCTLFP